MTLQQFVDALRGREAQAWERRFLSALTAKHYKPKGDGVLHNPGGASMTPDALAPAIVTSPDK